jgi:tetratricopeptide (TPR) repeat protein
VAAYQRAIEIAKPTGDAVFWRAAAWARGVQMGFGDAQKALAALEYALKLSDSRDDRVGASETLLTLGVAYRQLGRFVLSLDATERARALQLELGDRRGAAMTLCNLGVVYWDLGQIEKALGMYERALVDLEAVQDRDSIATTLGNLGATHERLGDPEHAVEQHARALAIWEALKDQGSAGACGRDGDVPRRHGRARPRAGARRARPRRPEAAGDKSGAVTAHVVLGKVLEQRGATAKSLQAFERAARGAEKLGATAIQVEALGELAATRLRAGDAGRAVSEAHRAVELMKTLVGGLGEEQSSSVRGEYTGLFSTGLRAAARVGDVAEAAFFLESGRAAPRRPAGARLTALGRRARGAPAGRGQARADGRGRWLPVEPPTATTARSSARAGRPRRRARRVAQAVERIQREAKQASRLAYPSRRRRGPPGAARRRRALVSGLAGDDPAHGLVLTRDDARIVEARQDVGDRGGVRALTDDPSATPRRARAPRSSSRRSPSPGNAPAAGQPRRRALGYVPFAALIADLEPTSPRLDVRRPARERTDPARGARPRRPRLRVKFDPHRARATRRCSAPARADRPRRAAHRSGHARRATVGDVTLLGKDASEGKLVEAVLQHSGRWRAIHFACHGLVDPDRPSLSSLALTPDGANDGFLTVLEVLRMDLRADLAVLSACETGRGKVVSGEDRSPRARSCSPAPALCRSGRSTTRPRPRSKRSTALEPWDGSPGKSPPPPARRSCARATLEAPYYWRLGPLGLPT